jgi:hypothetical protein
VKRAAVFKDLCDHAHQHLSTAQLLMYSARLLSCVTAVRLLARRAGSGGDAEGPSPKESRVRSSVCVCVCFGDLWRRAE